MEAVIEKHPVYKESVVGILAKKGWRLRSRTERPFDQIRLEASDLISEGDYYYTLSLVHSTYI